MPGGGHEWLHLEARPAGRTFQCYRSGAGGQAGRVCWVGRVGSLNVRTLTAVLRGETSLDTARKSACGTSSRQATERQHRHVIGGFRAVAKVRYVRAAGGNQV